MPCILCGHLPFAFSVQINVRKYLLSVRTDLPYRVRQPFQVNFARGKELIREESSEDSIHKFFSYISCFRTILVKHGTCVLYRY